MRHRPCNVTMVKGWEGDTNIKSCSRVSYQSAQLQFDVHVNLLGISFCCCCCCKELAYNMSKYRFFLQKRDFSLKKIYKIGTLLHYFFFQNNLNPPQMKINHKPIRLPQFYGFSKIVIRKTCFFFLAACGIFE